MRTNSSKVRINPDEQGNAIRVSKNNPEYAHMRITQERVDFGSNGWVNRKVFSALIHGKTEDLTEMGFKANEELPGNIVVVESFEGRTEDLKIAGETGIVCKGVDTETGEIKDIYRTTRYDSSGQMQSIMIPHVNGDEIREANGNTPKKTVSQSDLNELLTKKSDKKAKKEDEIVEEKKKEEEVVVENETFEL
jgi:putative methionine-R-sulfoxide reductase with GAF domain